MIKAFAVDLDGTLLNSEHEPDSNTLELAQTLRQKGYLFGIATGRPLYSAQSALPEMKSMFDFCISDNGGHVYDFVHDTHHEQFPLKQKTIFKILETYKQFGANPILSVDDTMYTEYEDDYNIRLRERVTVVYTDIKQIVQETHAKLIYSVTPQQQMDIMNYATKHPDNDYRVFISQHNLIEFMDPRVNKQEGLLWLAKNHQLGLENFMTFGDSDNDLEMVAGSGIGVAMANAMANVKKAAKYETVSNDESGIYRFILDYFESDPHS